MTEITAEQRAEIRRHCGYKQEKWAFDGWAAAAAVDRINNRLAAMTETDRIITLQYLESIALVEKDAKRVRAEGRNDYDALLANWRERFCCWIGVAPGPRLEKAK